MRIKILGCGGAINDGMPYNSFLIDDRLLCEAPPDIMVSLGREGSDPAKIDTLFISHFHADHCFGLPLFLLDRFFRYRGQDAEGTGITLVGPEGIGERTLSLVRLGLGESHPCLAWSQRNCRFREIGPGPGPELLPGVKAVYFPMEHFDVTYGFLFEENGRASFAYVADTVWSESVAALLAAKPAAALIDLNGEPDDPVQLHLSEQDLVSLALPITGNATHYYGTHLKKYKSSSLPLVTYAREGRVIEI